MVLPPFHGCAQRRWFSLQHWLRSSAFVLSHELWLRSVRLVLSDNMAALVFLVRASILAAHRWYGPFADVGCALQNWSSRLLWLRSPTLVLFSRMTALEDYGP